MTSRRRLLVAGALSAFAPAVSLAQKRPVKIGILSSRAKSFYTTLILKRLAELGYAEGTSASVEYRHADGAMERFPSVARELLKRECDLIFAIGSYQAPLALKQAGAAVPVVFLAVDYDPVQRRLVDHLARPGGNFTGVAAQSPLIGVKRLELAQELTAGDHFLVLSDPYTEDPLSGIKKASSARGLKLTLAEFKQRPYRYEAVFEGARQSGARAVIVLTSPVFADDRGTISALALKHRLPSVGFAIEDLFLIGHSANPNKMAHRSAEIAARILKGAKPADIPVHQADEFDLHVNLRTAKTLGLEIPRSIRVRATRVVE